MSLSPSEPRSAATRRPRLALAPAWRGARVLLRHWSRDRLQVSLSPTQLEFTRRSPILGGADSPSPAAARNRVPIETGAQGPDWNAGVSAFRAALASEAPGLEIAVVLSNHFVRYTLVPWRKDVRGDAEWRALAGHVFTTAYGPAARHWDIRFSGAPARAGRVACAVDAGLIEAIKSACAVARARLVSIEPLLMHVFNAQARRTGPVTGVGAWVVVGEPGRAVYGLLHDGCWQSIRSRRINDEPGMTLADGLAREAAVCGATHVRRVIYHGECPPRLPESYAVENTTHAHGGWRRAWQSYRAARKGGRATHETP